MIDFRILRHRLFGVINLASLFAASGFIGLLFIATVYLQAARGMSAFAAGSSTAPEAIGVLLSSQLVGRIYPRIGPRRLLVSGMVLVAAATVVLSAVMTQDLWVFRAVMFVIGLGWAFVVIPMNAGAFAQVSSRDTGRASALYQMQRQLASAIGVATLATIVGSQVSGAALRRQRRPRSVRPSSPPPAWRSRAAWWRCGFATATPPRRCAGVSAARVRRASPAETQNDR